VANFDTQSTQFVSVGRKGTQFLARTKRNVIADFPLKDNPTFLETKAISKFVIERFLSGDVDKVTVVYPRFVNTLTQKPTALPLLPITSYEEAGLPGDAVPPIPEPEGDILFEPSPEKILENVVPYYVHFLLFQTLRNTRASEHSARMVAMKSATDNAKEIVKDLTLEYNKARQANITKELLEITTAQLALG
jgi:F-type H+-transporting ATPase subunit gamma